jgi:hypothetical protein
MTIGVRMLQDPLAVLDAWIAKQKAPELSRLEAIRHLVDGTCGKEVSADAIGGTAGFERYATPCRSLRHFLILDLLS